MRDVVETVAAAAAFCRMCQDHCDRHWELPLLSCVAGAALRQLKLGAKPRPHVTVSQAKRSFTVTAGVVLENVKLSWKLEAQRPSFSSLANVWLNQSARNHERQSEPPPVCELG